MLAPQCVRLSTMGALTLKCLGAKPDIAVATGETTAQCRE